VFIILISGKMFQHLGHQLAAQLAAGTWADLDTF
jgi:hypothetical protein